MASNYKQQLDFIAYLQRLLQEGDFSSTYKFGLLHVLADICIEQPDINQKSQLKIYFNQIVCRLIGLYWQHARPFYAPYTPLQPNTQGGILRQNHGKQAKIIADIIKLQAIGIKSVEQAKSTKQWSKIYTNTLRTLKEGPLWRLQILSTQADCFLFPHIKNRDYIELHTGIAYCFRNYHDLVTHLAKQAWIKQIAKIQDNQPIIGQAGQLETFLFGSNRQSLKPAAALLTEIQQGTCFYCHKPLKSTTEVDHFIPFAKYNQDLAHNFVLAHPACNRNKRDYLAAPIHREHWLEQNIVLHQADISQALTGFYTCDPQRAVHVSDWAYAIAKHNRNALWLAKKDIFVTS